MDRDEARTCKLILEWYDEDNFVPEPQLEEYAKVLVEQALSQQRVTTALIEFLSEFVAYIATDTYFERAHFVLKTGGNACFTACTESLNARLPHQLKF